jgi:hypothetical protein
MRYLKEELMMKKWLLISCLLTAIVLLIIKDLYLNWPEIMVVILGVSVITSLIRHFVKKAGIMSVHIRTVCIAFAGFWLFSLFDIVGDHYLYFLPSGNEDGRALTIGEKIQEFSDDLLAVMLFISILLSISSKPVNKFNG